MIGLILKLVPALVLGLVLSLGTIFVSSSEQFNNIPSCRICLAELDVEIDTSGFPFSYAQERFEENNAGERVPLADSVESNIDTTRFLANWFVWSVVAFVGLFVLRKLRNAVGTVVVGAVALGMILIYFGIIVVA